MNMPTLLNVLCVLALASLLSAGCDLVGDESSEEIPVTAGVIVGTSGTFGNSNGTLMIRNSRTGATRVVQANAYLNSFTLGGGRLYAVLNAGSSGRVTVFDTTGYTARATYTFDTPSRYAALVGEETLYVTLDDFSGETRDRVAVVDLEEEESSYIDVGVSPQGVVVANDRAYVANAGGHVSIIDTESHENIDTVPAGCDNPYHVFVDGDDELVVVCTGATVYDENYQVIERTSGAVVFIDRASMTVTDSVALDVQLGSANFSQVAYYAPAAEELYAISTDMNPADSTGRDKIFRFDTRTNRLAGTIVVPDDPTLNYLSAVAYDARDERLYVGRLDVDRSFSTAGTIVALDRGGDVVESFAAGVVPAHIDFLTR